MPVNINTGAPGNPLDALLNGGPINGTVGFDIENALAQYLSGNGNPAYTPILAQMGLLPDENGVYNTDFSRFTSTGHPMVNGQEMVQLPTTSIGGQGQPIDPSLVQNNSTYGLITPYSNIKPISNGYGDLVFALASLGLAAPTAAYAMGANAGSTAGIASTDAAESGGTLALNAAGTGTVPYEAGLGATSSLPESYWNTYAQNGMSDVPTDGQFNGLQGYDGINNGGLDPETQGGLGGMPVSQNGIGPGSWENIIQGTVSNPSSLVGRAGGLLGDAGTWAMSHPLQAAGLLQTASGLIQSHRQTSGGGGGGKSSGGSGVPSGQLNIPPVNYTPNPFLMAQLQRGYQ